MKPESERVVSTSSSSLTTWSKDSCIASLESAERQSGKQDIELDGYVESLRCRLQRTRAIIRERQIAFELTFAVCA